MVGSAEVTQHSIAPVFRRIADVPDLERVSEHDGKSETASVRLFTAVYLTCGPGGGRMAHFWPFSIRSAL